MELIPEPESEQRKHIRWKQIGSLLETQESTSQRHVHDMQWLKNDKCILLKKKKKKRKEKRGKLLNFYGRHGDY